MEAAEVLIQPERIYCHGVPTFARYWEIFDKWYCELCGNAVKIVVTSTADGMVSSVTRE